MQQKNIELTNSLRFRLEEAKIPDILKGVDRWVMWRVGHVKANGKFSKVPVNDKGHNVNGLDANNWRTFREAHAAYLGGKCAGIGFVLNGTPILHNGEALFPIALDFDNCEDLEAEYRKLWLRLGKPYVEVSPSGKGLRMFALSRVPLIGGNDGNGHELYFKSRFVTVTGISAKGKICEATDELVKLHGDWFTVNSLPTKQRVSKSTLGSNLAHPKKPESVEAVSRVKELLSFVSSDCDRDKWRDIVWSVISTGWPSAVELVREWSMTAPHRYEADAFDQLVKSYDSSQNITLGTLTYHAKLAGWDSKPVSLVNANGQATAEVPIFVKDKFSFLTADEVKALPTAEYRIRGLLPSEGLAAVYGPSGSGKSFLVADLCFAIAAGLPEWFGRRVKPAPVIYVALEGSNGVRNRISALEAHYRMPIPNRFRFVFGGITLRNGGELVAFAKQAVDILDNGSVVVIDTLNQAAPGSDENSSQDMGEIISAAKLLGERLRGLVILVHHTGKDASRGLRGHSSLLAALDAAIEVENKAGFRAWSATKVKDDAVGGPQAFQLKSYTLGTDQDGLDMTSCAVERSFLPQDQLRPLSGRNQKLGANALNQYFNLVSDELTEDTAISLIASALENTHAGRRRTVAKEVLRGLLRSGHFFMNEGGVSRP